MPVVPDYYSNEMALNTKIHRARREKYIQETDDHLAVILSSETCADALGNPLFLENTPAPHFQRSPIAT
ncbi:MAG: hypothetical protein P1V97_04715 [Planctomycetota bacterium]|nr:hypothetical protein [Planctomycetota bacterium]